jgi:Na+/H+-dicarboxylate symporter
MYSVTTPIVPVYVVTSLKLIQGEAKMRKIVIKTAGWAAITTVVFVASGLMSGATLEVAIVSTLVGTAVKTPLYFGYEAAMKAWL